MVKVLVGALVGGIALFVWSYSTWMFLGIHDLDPEPLLQNEDGVIEALRDEERGVYWIPGGKMHEDPESDEAKKRDEKHKRGPIAFLVYDPKGAEPMATTTLAIGAGIDILIGLIVALMLAALAIPSFFGRFLLVFGIGVIVALVMDMQNWNWQNFPDDWTQGHIIEHVGGFAILGFLLALIVRPANRVEKF